MRGTGHDPNGSAKATLLAKTRAFRTRLAVSWHRELFAARLDELDDELAALWSDETMDLADKKQLLFARWDECAERFDVSTAGIPENASVRIDEARVDAALRARTTIEVFVRRHAPADSPQAYTNAELQRLNARRVSVRAFAPYAPKETS